MGGSGPFTFASISLEGRWVFLTIEFGGPNVATISFVVVLPLMIVCSTRAAESSGFACCAAAAGPSFFTSTGAACRQPLITTQQASKLTLFIVLPPIENNS